MIPGPIGAKIRRANYTLLACHLASLVAVMVFACTLGRPLMDFSPLVLEQVSAGAFVGYLILPLICIVIVALNLWGMGLAAYRLADDRRHPTARVLARHGDPETLAAAIAAEMAGPGSVHWAGGEFILLDNWVMREGLIGFVLVYIADVIWVCNEERRTYDLYRRYHGYRERLHYRAHIADRYGQHIACEMREHSVNRLVTWVSERAPWVVTEYHRNLLHRLHRDLPAFVGMVDEVRNRGQERLGANPRQVGEE